jgi:hypothetical protein
MKYAWKVSRRRHLIFDTGNPIVLGGRAMALHRRHKPIRGKVVSTSPKIVVLRPAGARIAYRGPPGLLTSKASRGRRSMCRIC